MPRIKLATNSSPSPSIASIKASIDKSILQACGQSGEQVVEAIQYHLKCGGSRQRALLSFATAKALGLAKQDCINLAACVEMLHNASLIHDDIQDKDMRRRGKASLWVKYGKDMAICVGDALIIGTSNALASLSTNYLPQVMHLVSQRTQETIRGQVKDINIKTALTLDLYREIAREKSAPLIALAMELPAIATGNKQLAQHLCAATSLFATAYQYSDDIDDCEDDRRAGEPNIVNILMQHSGYSADKAECQKLAIESVKDQITTMLDQAENTLLSVPDEVASGLYTIIRQLRNVTEDNH